MTAELGSLDLAVVQVWPVGVEPRRGLMTGFATNLGDPRVFGGNMATGATRLRSVVVELAFRGTSPSSPSLACPEVDALAVRAAGLPDDDAQLRRLFLRAVSTCAARLRGEGVEPAALRHRRCRRRPRGPPRGHGRGLVVGRWILRHPVAGAVPLPERLPGPARGRVAGLAVVPGSPTTSPAAPSAHARHWPSCSPRARPTLAARPATHTSSRPGTGRSVGTGARPLTGRGESGDGLVRVVVDDAKLLRFVRYSLGGEGPSNLAWLPRVITDAAAGRLDPHLADLVATDPPFCAGYRPQCLNMEGFALGVYLTSLCKEQVPGLDNAALRDAVAGQPAYKQVFERSPYLEACETWDTPAAQPTPPAHPHGTALLLVPGQFDSFSRPEWSRAEAEARGDVWSFTAPNNTHNTLGYDECALSVRNAWINAPRAAPDPTLCEHPPH